MLKDPFSQVSVYAQGPIIHVFEHALKDQYFMFELMIKNPFFICFSTCSRSNLPYVLAHAQGLMYHVFEHMVIEYIGATKKGTRGGPKFIAQLRL